MLKTLEEIYQIIDDPNYLIIDHNVNKLFKEFYDDAKLKDDIELIKRAQLEIDLQNFQINDNVLSPMYSGTDSSGQYFEYPSLKSLSDADLKYFEERRRCCKNPYLKAKYSHLLWLSPKKHFKFAKDAIKEYTKVAKHLNKVIWKSEEKADAHSLKLLLSNLFYLTVSTGNKKEIEKVKRIILTVVRKFRFDSDKTYINIGLIQLMLKNAKVFKNDDFKNLESYCLRYANVQKSTHSKIDILIVAQKVAQKLGKNDKMWDLEIGKAYEKLSFEREDGTNLAAITFCQNAIRYFKKAKDKVKTKELEDHYKHLKQSMKLGVFAQDIDLTEIVQDAQKIAKQVLAKSPEYILSFLMYSSEIFPSYDYLYSLAVEQKKQNGFEFLFGTALNDQYGHTSAHYNTEEEKLHLEMMKNLDFLIQTSSVILLREIILKAVEQNKLSTLSVLEFLKKGSWIGQDIHVTYSQGEEKQYNWLKILAPGINDFLSQLFFFFQNPINLPNFTLPVDSLVIKIEGILRDICELRGVNTFFQTTDAQGRIIAKEKDINTLLYEDIIKETLNKDDLLVLRFLLIDKAGWNLRNKIAHTLIRESYHISYMLILFVVILRLGKAEYAPPEKTTQ